MSSLNFKFSFKLKPPPPTPPVHHHHHIVWAWSQERQVSPCYTPSQLSMASASSGLVDWGTEKLFSCWCWLRLRDCDFFFEILKADYLQALMALLKPWTSSIPNFCLDACSLVGQMQLLSPWPLSFCSLLRNLESPLVFLCLGHRSRCSFGISF